MDESGVRWLSSYDWNNQNKQTANKLSKTP